MANLSYKWLGDTVAPPRMSPSYRLGLVVVSLTVILLPALYVLLCGGIAYGIYAFAADETQLLASGPSGSVAYAGVILAGAVTLVFMVKPFFASRRKIKAYVELTRQTEPQLFAFIDEICTRIGSPRPQRVRVDNQVNASASFEHGWSGVFRGRLVLNIGLPVAAGLTVSQFGGVLAHEFGHFTQASAMRFTYAIRATNLWFSRLIFERDRLDSKLSAWSRRGNIYALAFVNAAMAFIWLARRILWVLMRAGHAVSAYLMRQMEYDADRFQLQVAGPQDFRETFLLMRLMNASAEMSNSHLTQLWKDGRLVDNIPLLTQRLFTTIPDAAVQQLRSTLDADTSVTQWFATHPSDRERLARAAAIPVEPLLRGDEPATALFRDFPQLAEELTLIDYRERFHVPVTPEKLMTTDAHLQEHLAHTERVQVVRYFFSGLLHEHRLIFPHNHQPELDLIDDSRARKCKSAAALALLGGVIERVTRQIEEARGRRAQAYRAWVLTGLGLKIRPAALGLADSRRKTISATVDQHSAAIQDLREQLEPVVQLAQQKFYDYAHMAACPDWLERVAGSEEWAAWLERIEQLKATLQAMEPIYDHLAATRKSFYLASVCIENVRAAGNPRWAKLQLETWDEEFRVALAHIEQLSVAIPYPLQDGRYCLHLAGYFVAGNDQEGPLYRFTYLRSVYERFVHVYNEVVIELLEKLAAVEKGSVLDIPRPNLASRT